MAYSGCQHTGDCGVQRFESLGIDGLPVASAGWWHDGRMVWFARIVAAPLSDALGLVLPLLHSSSAIRAENLVLRKQLANTSSEGSSRGVLIL